jgi:MFS family permease
LTALRVPSFRRVWAAGLISETGDWLLLISLPVLVYQLTGSTLGTGVAFLVEMLPPIALMPLAGWIADHLNRSRTLAVVSFIQALALAPLLVAHSLVIIYVILAVESGLATIFESAKNALLPTLVGMDQLISANSLIGLIQNLGRLVGAPLGGLLLALGGPRTVGAVDCASFLIAIPLLARVPDRRTGSVQPRRAQGERPRPKILGALAVMAMISLAQGAFVVLFVVFVAKMLHGGSTETGLLRGLQAVGALGCSLLLAGGRARALPAGRLAGFGALAIGIVSLCTWNAPRLTTAEAAYVILFVIIGFPAMFLSTGLTSWLQEATTDAQRGRVFAAYVTVGTSCQAAGSLIAGILGDRIDVGAILNGQAITYVAAGMLALIVLGKTGKSLSPAGLAEKVLTKEN